MSLPRQDEFIDDGARRRRGVAVAGDVRDTGAVSAFVDRAIAHLGWLDILVMP